MTELQDKITAIEASAHYADGFVTLAAYEWEQLKLLAGIDFEPEYLEIVL